MNKKCKICGADVPYEARFCQKCGSSEFITTGVADEQTGILNEPNNPYQNQPVHSQPQYNQYNGSNQQVWQQPFVQQSQPKKKKTGLIIGVVAACILVLAIIGMIAEDAFQEQGYGDNSNDYNDGYSLDFDLDDNYDDEDFSSNIANDIEYTKGNFDGTTYINEWADIRVDLPSGFSNADAATYTAAENSTTDCGVYFMADDTMSLIYICYEKLPSFPTYDEDAYLDSAMSNLKGQSGITYETDDSYTTTNIAGKAYVTAECNFNNGYGDFVQSIYVRKVDDYMVFISAISNSAASNNVLANTITSAR